MHDDDTPLPSAYKIAPLNGQYYPMRFGKFRIARGKRIHFPTYAQAAAYCWREQADYERERK